MTNQVFNLLIAGNDEAWTGPICEMPISRFGEYSDRSLLSDFTVLLSVKDDFPFDLERLKRLPTLLGYERNDENPAFWVRITELRQFGNTLKFKYDRIPSAPKIENLYDRNVAFDLGIDVDSFEVSRTHWALKMGSVPSAALSQVVNEPKALGNVMSVDSVFIVHGHDDAAVHEVARTISTLKLKPIILREQPDRGQTIIQKFETHAGAAAFAVVLLTPDDVGGKKGDSFSDRARQNVILELGYFVGKIGRSRVLPLKKGDIELPNDILGVLYTQFDIGGAWKLKLASELKAAGFSVDMNDLS